MDIVTYVRSFGIGCASGMRSMTGPALARRRSDDDPTRRALAIMALGELVVDKLPFTPSRTLPPAALVRLVAGGYAGGSLAADREGSRVVGALAGMAGAAVGTYGFGRLRAEIGRRTGWPDPLVAVLEDALAVGFGYALTAA